jgi:hypothetical protein
MIKYYIDWIKEYKAHFSVFVLSLFATYWAVTSQTLKPAECVCESCEVECLEECEVCEVKIVDGRRLVCRGDKCFIYPIEEEGQTGEVNNDVQ